MSKMLFTKEEQQSSCTRTSWEALICIINNTSLIEEYDVKKEMFAEKMHQEIFEKLKLSSEAFKIESTQDFLNSTVAGNYLTGEEVDFLLVISKNKPKNVDATMSKFIGSTKNEFELTSDLDEFDANLQQLNKLIQAEEKYDFYPFAVAPQTVNTLVAPTNVGKTTLSLGMSNEIAAKGHKVALLSTEESKLDITRRRQKMNDKNLLANQFFFGESLITKDYINKLFKILRHNKINYLIIDYVNPHNIDIEADLAQKIDVFYQWLINNAQQYNICVFALIQANSKAYNDKIDVVKELTTKPNHIATFTDGGIRSIVKSYSVVYLHRDSGERTIVACKGRSFDADDILGSTTQYDVDIEELRVKVYKNILGGDKNGTNKNNSNKGW